MFNIEQISIKINQNVLLRIKKSVINSNVEVGGKLIGRFQRKNGRIIFQIQSYIDSGPAVQQTPTFLYPDPDYQVHCFRTIETFVPKIEHLGSWHSHHCNQFPDLSGGDINGYNYAVNHHQYSLDYFIAMLVTKIHNEEPVIRYFIFKRGQKSYQEYPSKNIKIINNRFCMEDVLEQLEMYSNKSFRRIKQLA